MFSRGGKKIRRPGHQVLSEALRRKGFNISDAHINWEGMISIKAEVGRDKSLFSVKKQEFVGNWGEDEQKYIDAFEAMIKKAIASEKAAKAMDEALD